MKKGMAIVAFGFIVFMASVVVLPVQWITETMLLGLGIIVLGLTWMTMHRES